MPGPGVRRRTDTAPVLHALHTRLSGAGYTAEALKQRLGISFPDDIGALNRAAALERLRDDRSAAATLMRLLFLEAPEPERRVASVLSRGVQQELRRLGFLQMRAGAVRARLRIDAVAQQYFIADRRFHPGAASAMGLPGRDPVYPPSSDSLLLRDAVLAPRARHALDLCTGSGVQALRLAGDAERIVAVDMNPRAAAVARMNAQLNAASNIEVRTGDLYEPVAGERFDVIIANPPFVPSPYAGAPAYHSGGAVGDRVLRRIISGWGRHLTAAGRAFAISHRALRAGEDIEGVARSWFRDFPGRALVLVLERGTAVDLAAAQALFALQDGLGAYAREVARWTAHLRRNRIQTVTLLLIVAQRGARRQLEVVEAQPRILPIPLTPSARDRVAGWFA